MARKNRVSVPDGTYHITSRIVNRELWFSDPKLKDLIVEWLYGVAAFSGVELLSWCIMDNHFHVFVHVPEVPECYRLDPGVVPDSHAFGMRPPECRPALWSPAEGDNPRLGIVRPALGFMLSDEEMLGRLRSLYGDEGRVEAIRRNWTAMRVRGDDAAVDALKARYCRRMYNVSQFVKTLKERIASALNRRTGHVGHVFEGRFYSGLVEGNLAVSELVSLYIDYNPYKAGLVGGGELYRWGSFGQANGAGRHGAECRAAYERLFGRPWEEVRAMVLAAFRDRLPEGEDVRERILAGRMRVRPAQLVKLRIGELSRGAYIGRSAAFAQEATAVLAKNFPRVGGRSLARLARMVEWPKLRNPAA